jgi:hypothetical protein
VKVREIDAGLCDASVATRAAMPNTYALMFSTELHASIEAVWEVVGTMRGVNAELAPWLRMTAPAEASNMRIDDAPVGQCLFASWVLFAGVLPIDRHFLSLADVERGRGFVEQSISWSQRRWEHQRHLESYGDGRCVVTDRLAFVPRIRISGPLLNRVVGAVFGHRHRVLRERFGGEPRGADAMLATDRSLP